MIWIKILRESGSKKKIHQYLPDRYHEADIERVCKYILNQKAHHHKFTFREEYDQQIKHYQQTLRSEKASSKLVAVHR